MSIRTRTQAKKAKQTAEIVARYDAAGMGRRMKGWTTPSTGPQRALQGLQRIRDRARDAERNDWAGASFGQKWTTSLVGVGITPRWASDRHTAIWDDFVPQADADGMLDAYGQQALAVRSWIGSGEVFQRRRWRSVDAPLELPVQVQTIEADYCPLFDADTWPGMPDGNRIRQGIELNKYDRRIAYWFYKQHPGDGRSGLVPNAGELIRVAASDVTHVFEVKRPGQLRGVSELAPVLARLRNGGDFEDAVLERQKLANLFTVFFTKPLPSQWNDMMVDPNTGLPKEWTSKGAPMQGLEPGMGMEMQPGEDVKFANPPDAGVSFRDYLRTLHMGTAAGGGLPYELMAGDVRDVSDRTLRVVIQEFRRFASQRQWHVVIPRICRPVIEWVADAAILAGRLRASERKVFTRPEWSPHGWDYIHPVQDIQGKQLAIEAGITSQSAVISERGEDPRKVIEQRAADAKRNKELGLPEPGVQKPAAPAGNDPAAAPGGNKQAQQTAAMQGTLDSIVALLARPAPAPVAAAPDPALGQVLAVMAQALQQNMQMVQAMQALATAVAQRPIEVQSPTVNVAAPTVNVAAPAVSVEVPPATLPVIENHIDVAPATVVMTLEMPDRVSETTVETDDAGNVIASKTVETTVKPQVLQ